MQMTRERAITLLEKWAALTPISRARVKEKNPVQYEQTLLAIAFMGDTFKPPILEHNKLIKQHRARRHARYQA